MGKKKSTNTEHYLYVIACVEDGNLRWKYRLNGSSVIGREKYDEDVSEWSEVDIVSLTKSMLSIAADDPVQVQVRYG